MYQPKLLGISLVLVSFLFLWPYVWVLFIVSHAAILGGGGVDFNMAVVPSLNIALEAYILGSWPNYNVNHMPDSMILILVSISPGLLLLIFGAFVCVRYWQD